MTGRDPPLRIDPEFRIVLLSAAGPWADESARVLLDRTDLRWPLLLEFARRQGALPVLLRRLGHWSGGTELDAAVHAAQPVADILEFRMGILEERLGGFVDALEKRDIRVVLLKGSAIALGRLGGMADRPMGDLDLLVPADRAVDAHELALSMNWTTAGRGLHPDMYADMHHLIPLDAGDGLGFGLEIHTDLFPDWSPFRFSAEEVWRDAVPLKHSRLASQTLLPSLHHQILHTCLHYAWSHCFGRGGWRMVRDLDVLLDDPDFEVDAFVALAQRSRGSSCVYWTLSVLEALTGRSLPTRLTEPLATSVHRSLRGPLLRHLTREGLRQVELPGTRRLRRALWAAAIRPRRSGHGASRPWSGAERWPGADDPFGLEQAPGDRLTARLRGFIGYTAHILAGRGTA